MVGDASKVIIGLICKDIELPRCQALVDAFGWSVEELLASEARIFDPIEVDPQRVDSFAIEGLYVGIIRQH